MRWWFLHRDRRVVWVSQVAAWGNTEQAGADYVIVGLLGHIWILFLEHLIWLPLDVMLVQWPLFVSIAIFSLLRVELYMLCVVEFCYVPVVLSLDLLIMHLWWGSIYAMIEGNMWPSIHPEPHLPVPRPGGW